MNPPESAPLTALDFQLVVLRRMADFHPERVADALRELSTDRTRMRAANRRWQASLRSAARRGALTRYLNVLGTPAARDERRVGQLVCEAVAWRLPLWDDLRFEVLTAPGGGIWHETLARAPGAEPPPLRDTADLLPWSCTLEEVARAFAPAVPLEGSAPTRWRLSFTPPPERAPGGVPGPGTAPAATGTPTDGATPRPVIAEFCYGLLQRLVPPPSSAPQP
ncbi:MULTISPECIES: hypothetical protein [unclassified Streptomyces]|uniref:hypothetical protein n=2 Tax=Streptomyces TaxID=1883 RepID=UPI000CD4F9FB|nr:MULTISPECIES: hypothetical protein [unclassified Streptomyces]